VALDLVAELDAVLDSFARAKVDHALCGGLALAVHGHPRATMDIDLLIRPDDLEVALQAAAAVGFDVPARKMIFGLATGDSREIQRVSKVDPDTGSLLTLDLVLAGPSLEDVMATRIATPWRGRPVSVVSRDGLARMKRLAGRPRDLADIAALEGTDEEA
jgi:hypothetical protein